MREIIRYPKINWQNMAPDTKSLFDYSNMSSDDLITHQLLKVWGLVLPPPKRMQVKWLWQRCQEWPSQDILWSHSL